MRTVDMHAAKTNLSRLVEAAANGEPFIIARAGTPVVKVVAVEVPEAGERRRIGFMSGRIAGPDDFDGMGSQDIRTMFSGRGAVARFGEASGRGARSHRGARNRAGGECRVAPGGRDQERTRARRLPGRPASPASQPAGQRLCRASRDRCACGGSRLAAPLHGDPFERIVLLTADRTLARYRQIPPPGAGELRMTMPEQRTWTTITCHLLTVRCPGAS